MSMQCQYQSVQPVKPKNGKQAVVAGLAIQAVRMARTTATGKENASSPAAHTPAAPSPSASGGNPSPFPSPAPSPALGQAPPSPAPSPSPSIRSPAAVTCGSPSPVPRSPSVTKGRGMQSPKVTRALRTSVGNFQDALSSPKGQCSPAESRGRSMQKSQTTPTRARSFPVRSVSGAEAPSPASPSQIVIDDSVLIRGSSTAGMSDLDRQKFREKERLKSKQRLKQYFHKQKCIDEAATKAQNAPRRDFDRERLEAQQQKDRQRDEIYALNRLLMCIEHKKWAVFEAGAGTSQDVTGSV